MPIDPNPDVIQNRKEPAGHRKKNVEERAATKKEEEKHLDVAPLDTLKEEKVSMPEEEGEVEASPLPGMLVVAVLPGPGWLRIRPLSLKPAIAV